MGQIFQQAERVLITLGSDPSHEALAQDVASLVLEVNSMIEKTLAGFDDDDWDTFPNLGPEDPLRTDSRWEAFGQLEPQPWFSRGWVIQETILCRNAQLLWGYTTIDWTSFLRVCHWMRFRAPLACRRMYPIQPLHGEFFEYQFRFECKPLKPPGSDISPRTTLDILASGRAAQFTDERDRVYAFLALPVIKDELKGLPINYHKPYLEVYRDTALWYFRRTRDLSILHEVMHDAASLDMNFPSWVPQWHKDFIDCMTVHASADKYITSPFSEVDPHLIGSSILKTRGVLFDTLATTAPSFCNQSYEISLKDVQSVWDFVSGQALVYTFPHLLAFHCAIMAGGWPTDFSHEEDRGLLQSGAHMAMTARQGSLEPDLAAKFGVLRLETFELKVDKNNVDITRVHRHIQRNLRGRRIAVTSRGYLALVPAPAQPGDVCAVIFGTKAPFILRRCVVDDADVMYKVVGDAFVVSNDEYEGFYLPRHLGAGAGRQDWLEWNLDEEDLLLC